MKEAFARAGVDAWTRENGQYFRDYRNDEEWWIADYEGYSYANMSIQYTPTMNPWVEGRWTARGEMTTKEQVNALLPDTCPVRLGDSYLDVCRKLGATDAMAEELLTIPEDSDIHYYHESSPGGYMLHVGISDYDNEVFDHYHLHMTNKNYEYSFTFLKETDQLTYIRAQGVLNPQAKGN